MRACINRNQFPNKCYEVVAFSFVFQCSIADCGKIVQRKADHLKKVHNIGGEQMTRLSLAMKRVNGAQADLKITKTKKPARSEKEEKRLANKKRSRKSSSESSDEEEERWAKKRKISKLAEEKKSRELISESSNEDEERLAKRRKFSESASSPSKDDEAGSASESFSEEKEAGTQAPVRMERIWIEYYRKWDERKTSVREHYMAGFFKYLTGAYGGMMPDKNAVEHVRRVHIMLNIIDSNGDDLHCLVKKERDKYLRQIRGATSPGKEVVGWNVEVLSGKHETLFHLCPSRYDS